MTSEEADRRLIEVSDKLKEIAAGVTKLIESGELPQDYMSPFAMVNDSIGIAIDNIDFALNFGMETEDESE